LEEKGDVDVSDLASFLATDPSEYSEKNGKKTSESESEKFLDDLFQKKNKLLKQKENEQKTEEEEEFSDQDEESEALKEALEIRKESSQSQDSSKSKESSTEEIILCNQNKNARKFTYDINGNISEISGEKTSSIVPLRGNMLNSMSQKEMVYGSSGNPNTCFLCLFGNVQYDSMVSTKLQVLWEMLASNYFSMTDTRGMAAAAYAYYHNEIYLEGLAEGKDLPKWSSEGMYIHITQHMGEPRIFLGESIKELSNLRRVLTNMSFEEDEEGICKPNVKIISEIRMLSKQIRELYMSDPQNMFGYCEAFKADASSMHRLSHMSRIKVHENTIIQNSKGTFS